MAAKKKQEEEALLNGFDMSCDLDIDKEELKLSSWSPTMIMVPSSVVENWKNEFKTWVHFEVAVYEGNNDNKDSAFERVKAGLAEIMLVPHSIFKQNPASNSHLEKFLTIPWKLVVVDEFHVFKNDDTHGSKNLRQLKKQHRCLVLGMTGTPMQNHHKELWNIVDLAETGYLGTWDDFELKFSIPIKNGRAKNADESTIEKSIRKANVLAQKMTKILLSRTKEIVLANELPEKNEKFVLCELSPLQKSLYEHILSLPDFEIIRTAIQPCSKLLAKD
jgi:SNF2 family DNA or RNA helicase